MNADRQTRVVALYSFSTVSLSLLDRIRTENVASLYHRAGIVFVSGVRAFIKERAKVSLVSSAVRRERLDDDDVTFFSKIAIDLFGATFRSVRISAKAAHKNKDRPYS